MQRITPFRIAIRLTIGLVFLMVCIPWVEAQPDPAAEKKKQLIETALLKSDNPNVQRIALVLLSEIGFDDPLGPKMAPQVIALLESTTDPVLKREGIYALGKINPQPVKSTAVFKAYIADPDPTIRRSTIKGLESWMMNARTGKWWTPPEPFPLSYGIAPLAADIAWSEEHPDQLLAAVERLRSKEVFDSFIARITDGLPLVGDAIADPDPEVRNYALDAFLRGFQRLAPNIIAELTKSGDNFLEFDETDLRVRIGEKIFDKVVSEQLQKLSPILRSPNEKERLKAVQILEAAGSARRLLPNPARKLPAEGVSIPTAPITLVALRQKEKAAPAPSAAPLGPVKIALRELLLKHSELARDPSVQVRQVYANAIETLGSEAAPLTNTLVELARDPVLYVRWTAIRTMGNVAPKEAAAFVPVLDDVIAQEKDLDVRSNALTSLERFENAGASEIDSVVVVMGRGDADTRIKAVQIIPKLKAPFEVVVPPLGKALRTPDDEQQSFAKLRKVAAEVLHELGANARLAANDLTEGLRDPDPEIRRLCAETLLEIGKAVIEKKLPPTPAPDEGR